MRFLRRISWLTVARLTLLATSIVYLYGAAFWLVAARHMPRRIVSTALTGDGSRLLLGANAGHATLWSVSPPEKLRVFERRGFGSYTNPIDLIVIAPDERMAAIGGGGNTVDLFDLASGELHGRLGDDHGFMTIRGAAFAPNGPTIALARESGLEVWDVATRTKLPIEFEHRERVYFVAYSPDGALLASGGDASDMHVWRAATGELVCRLPRDDGQGGYCSLAAVSFTADGQRLRALDQQGLLLEWNLATQQRSARRVAGSEIRSAAYSSDRRHLAVAMRDGPVLVFDEQGQSKFQAQFNGAIAVALSAHGERLAAAGGGGARAWSMKANTHPLGRYTVGNWHGWTVAATLVALTLMWAALYSAGRAATPRPTVSGASAGSMDRPARVIAAAPSRRSFSRRPELAVIILVAGGVIYVVGCMPAIGRRGYPPIDSFWMAIPWLWPFPELIAALFDGSQFASYRKALFGYALGTAFFDAGTMGGITPRHVDVVGMLVFTLIGYGPMHLLVAFALDLVAQAIYRPLRKLVDLPEQSSATIPLRLRAPAIVIGVLALCAPFVYRTWERRDSYARGRAGADEAWRRGEAELVIDPRSELPMSQRGPYLIQRHFDPTTGLRLETRLHRGQYSTGYTDRVAELLAQGAPPGSLKAYLIGDDEMIAMLSASGFEVVTKFPRSIGPVLDVTETSVRSGHSVYGMLKAPIEFARFDQHPQVVFVRTPGTVMAFHDSGQMLGSVSGPTSPSP